VHFERLANVKLKIADGRDAGVHPIARSMRKSSNCNDRGFAALSLRCLSRGISDSVVVLCKPLNLFNQIKSMQIHRIIVA